MEVEPNFSRLSFDMSLSEADKLVQQDTPADTVHSSVFNTPSEATMAMVVDPVSANVSSQDGFTVADSNLIDESSFFEGGDLSTNNVMLQDDEDFWRGIDQELLAFQSASCTRPNKNEMLLASPVDGSSFPWQDSSAHEPGYLFTESNVCSEITLSGCEQELFGPSTMGYQVLDFTDANPASMNAADEYDPIGCLNYTFPNEHGIYTDLALSVQLDGTVNSWLGNQYSDDRGDMSDPNLYIRPDVLALISPYRSPLSQPNHPKNRTTDEDHELLTTVDIADNLQVNPPPSRPIPAFDDLIVNFDLNPRPPPSKRKRSSFTRAGKEKVRLVRDSGACVFCRSRKVSCSAEEVCNQCRRTVDDPIIARQICLRTRIQDLYIGVKELHGASLVARKERLQPFLTSLDGEPQDVRLSLDSETESHQSIALCVQVMRCTVSPKCRWKSLRKARGIYITSNLLKEKRYVIIPSSLPGVEDLDTFGRDILLMSAGSLSGKMTRLLDDFLSCYCHHGGPSRLRNLSNLTLRIASLNNFVAYGFLNLQDGSYKLLERLSGEESDPENFVSETVHDQIRILAAEGLEPAEKHVFSELDNLPKIIGGSNHARIIAGTCLLRLLVLYRDKLLRDQIRLELPGTKPYHQLRIEKSAFMYRRLTVAYGTLCREHDSPLTMTWEDEEKDEHISGNEELKMLFSQLRCEFRQFCRENLTGQYDDVFKSLISEPIKGRKTRKRRRTST